MCVCVLELARARGRCMEMAIIWRLPLNETGRLGHHDIHRRGGTGTRARALCVRPREYSAGLVNADDDATFGISATARGATPLDAATCRFDESFNPFSSIPSAGRTAVYYAGRNKPRVEKSVSSRNDFYTYLLVSIKRPGNKKSIIL